MEIHQSENSGRVEFAVSGIIDEKGAEELKARLKTVPLTKGTEVVIDCLRLQQIGSSGIGKLLLLYKNLAASGGRLAVINLPTAIYDLFLELKLDSLFLISKAP